MRIKLLPVLLFIVSIAFTGCMAEDYVYEQPPPPRVEAYPVAPGPNFVWVGGHWTWHRNWEWIPGHWAERPYRGMIWMPGHWLHHYNGWQWIPGHWR